MFNDEWLWFGIKTLAIYNPMTLPFTGSHWGSVWSLWSAGMEESHKNSDRSDTCGPARWVGSLLSSVSMRGGCCQYLCVSVCVCVCAQQTCNKILLCCINMQECYQLHMCWMSLCTRINLVSIPSLIYYILVLLLLVVWHWEGGANLFLFVICLPFEFQTRRQIPFNRLCVQ